MKNLRFFTIILIMFLICLACASAISAQTDGRIVVVLDPGHGGIDGGSDAGTRAEKEYNFELAQYLREELEKNGNFTVYLTREEDVYLRFLPRTLTAVENNADVIISMHCNDIAESYIDGTLAYISVVDKFSAYDLAALILDRISAAVPIRRGAVQVREDTGDEMGIYYWDETHQWDMPSKTPLGKRSDYYSMNTWGSKFGIPSMIVEHGYLSNASDLAVLDNPDNLRAIAKAEADALIEYYLGHEHTWGVMTVDYPSSCSMAGAQSRRCTVCGARSDTEAIPISEDNHFWRAVESKNNTCTGDGYVKYICQVSYNLNDKGYPCTVHEYTEIFAAAGHKFEVFENYFGDGRLFKRCTVCGFEETVDPCGGEHKYAVVETVPATCAVEGKIVYKCSSCEDVREESLPLTEHDIVTETAFPPTCTEDGSTVTKCAVCGLVLSSDTIKAEHKFSLTRQTDEGEIYTCSVCGEEKNVATERRVPQMSYKTLAVAATAVLLVCVIAFIVIIIIRGRRNAGDSPEPEPDDDYVAPFEGEESLADGIFPSCGEISLEEVSAYDEENSGGSSVTDEEPSEEENFVEYEEYRIDEFAVEDERFAAKSEENNGNAVKTENNISKIKE